MKGNVVVHKLPAGASYGIAILSVLLAALVRWMMSPVIGHAPPYITFFAAIMLSAVVGGLGPGLLATALSGLLGNIILVEPYWRFHPSYAEFIRLALVWGVGIFISVVCGMLHTARRQAETEGQAAREAQAAQRESEGRYRASFEFAAVGQVQADPATGRFLEFNERFCQITGYSRDELSGMSISQITHPEDQARGREGYAKMLRGEVPAYVAEKRYLRKDGKVVWVRVTASAVRDDAGRPLHMVVIVEDISTRKAAEESLEDSEAKLRAFYNSVPMLMGVVELSEDERDILHLYGNPATARFLGWGPESTAKRSSRAMGAPPEIIDLWVKRYRESEARDEPVQFEYKRATATGTRWIGATVARIGRSPSGQMQFCYVAEDITERKQAEEAKATLAAIVESSNDAIVGETLDGRISSWNAGAERLFGYRAEEALGQPVSLLIPLEYPDEVSKELDRVSQGERVEHVEAERVRKDGERIVVRLSVSPIKDSQGRIIGIAKLAHDITDLKRAQEALRAARDSAEAAKAESERANKAKDQFLAVLSHELRTPLTPVLVTAELLEKDATLPASIRADAEMIRRNAALEARLIDDLLDLTRIARGKIELAREHVDLCTVLQRTVEVCMPDIEARRLHFAMEMKDTPHRLHADPSRLQQVFWNILKNAIKFTPPGGCVGVRCYGQDGKAVVEIADSGAGIEPAALPRVFDAFEQGDRTVTRQFGGLGLGLAIGKALVSLHGGTISAYSEGKGKGAMIRVVLPTVLAPAAPRRVAEGDGSRGKEQRRGLRILLVEDHGDTARIMSQILQMEGHAVRTAGDIATALESATEGDFDLIISDLGLPDGSGLDLMRQLQSVHRAVKGIALSGYGREEDIQKSREVGFAEHLTKPVDVNHLNAAITRVAEMK